MRPIFRPSARISERSPLAVGWDSRMSSSGAAALLFVLLVDFAVAGLGAGGTASLRSTLGFSTFATVVAFGGAGVLSSLSASTTTFFVPSLRTVVFTGASSVLGEAAGLLGWAFATACCFP